MPAATHQAPIIKRESPTERAARVHARIGEVLDAERYRMEKAALRVAHDEARAGRLSKPDTFHSVRAEACKDCGMVYVAPFIEYPPANNVKMQHSGRSIWPGARTKEADPESDTKYFLRARARDRDAQRKKLERKPVREVAAYDEK